MNEQKVVGVLKKLWVSHGFGGWEKLTAQRTYGAAAWEGREGMNRGVGTVRLRSEMSFRGRLLLLCLALTLCREADAARCKVGDTWYPYDSPECQAPLPRAPETLPIPTDDASAPALPPNAYTPPRTVPAFERTWSEVQHTVAGTCERSRRNAVSHARCLADNEAAYWALQGRFGLPEDAAAKAKAWCAQQSDDLRNQLRCMKGEVTGYAVFTHDFAMPANYQSEARSRCTAAFSSFSERGECMTQAEAEFAGQYGDQFYKPRKLGREWVTPQQPQRKALASIGQGPQPYSPIVDLVTDPQSAPAREPADPGPPPVFRMDLLPSLYQLGIAQDSFAPSAEFERFLDEAVERFSLDVGAMQDERRAFLELVDAQSADPRRGARFDPGVGRAVLHLAVEPGRSYLVDFAVSATALGSYRVAGEFVEVLVEDPAGRLQHVLVLVSARSLGWTQLDLVRDFGGDFHLQGVDVTSLPTEVLPERR